MINTVESRSPFLDTNINKYLNIPDNMKFKNGYNKFLLRKILSDKAPERLPGEKIKMVSQRMALKHLCLIKIH